MTETVSLAYREVVNRLARRFDRLPLFWGVVAVNALIALLGVALLALTPLEISFPIAAEQAIILVVGALLLIVVDGLLLRAGLRPLLGVLAAMQGLDLLAAREQVAETGSAEVRALTRTFNEMFERLEEERRSSAYRVLAALEGERRRVGQELHDEIGQRLTGMLLELSPAIAEAPPALRTRLAELQEEVRATIDEVGRLAWQLRPGILDDLGLLAALDSLLSSADESSDVQVLSTLPDEAPLLEPEVELAVYRVAQEAVTNALRHAQPGTLALMLAVDAGGLMLTVSDDGSGLPPAPDDGPGIQGMRERAHLLNGTLRMHSPGALGGVTIQLHIPLEDKGG